MYKPLKTQSDPPPDSSGVFVPGAKALRAGLYARVSTHDQKTLPMQLSAMRDYAEKRGWTVAVEVKDVGSGATTRPQRETLIEAARRREIDCVLVWRLDRWGRSLVDLVNTLQELTAIDVGFVSLSEALDLTTPSGRALAGMLAVFAEFERDILPDRDHAGCEPATVHIGQPLGRVQVPLLIAVHSGGREREVQQVGGEPPTRRIVSGAQAAVVSLGASHDVLDVRLSLAVEPTPRVRTVDPAQRQRIDDLVFNRLRVRIILRVVGRAAPFWHDGQTTSQRLCVWSGPWGGPDAPDAQDQQDADQDAGEETHDVEM